MYIDTFKELISQNKNFHFMEPNAMENKFYLSTVKQTKFQVDVIKPPQRRKSEFQRWHSKYPSIPFEFVWVWSFIVRENSNSINEQNKSAEL